MLPIVELGLAPIKTKIFLKIPNCWKIAIKPAKNPTIKEKSRSFFQSSFFIIENPKIQKKIKNKKLTNPPPLFGSPHKLNGISSENKVEIKTVKEKAKREIKGRKILERRLKVSFPPEAESRPVGADIFVKFIFPLSKKTKNITASNDLNAIASDQAGGVNHGGIFNKGNAKIIKNPIK